MTTASKRKSPSKKPVKNKVPKSGDYVTCLYEIVSNYHLTVVPNVVFKPGMLGRVATIAPKVTKSLQRVPWYDQKDDFLVVDFIDERGKTRRVALDFCNAKVIDDTYSLTVTFTRSFSADRDIIDALDDNLLVGSKHLVDQFVSELQAAYNETEMAGHFNVTANPVFK